MTPAESVNAPRRADWLALAVLIAVAVLVWSRFPQADGYFPGADEGVYYRQGKALLELGARDGFAQLARDYLRDASQQIWPDPLRVGTIAASALALAADDSYRSLSWVSLLAFVGFLAAAWGFLRTRFARDQALITLVLLAVSPLALALARRALMDSLAFTTSMLAVFAFFRLLENRGRYAWLVFAAASWLAILVKETALLLLPFFAVVLLHAKLRRGLGEGWVKLLLALALPPLCALVVYVGVYGVEATLGLFAAVRKLPTLALEYHLGYMQGPWYRYLIDFLTLSPWTLLLGIAGLGYVAATRGDRRLLLLGALAAYLLWVYAPMTKTVRYMLPLDVAIRCFAAAAIVALPRLAASPASATDTEPRNAAVLRWIPWGLLALLCWGDVAAFGRFFSTGNVYDPVTYNLLRVERIVPEIAPRHDAPATLAAARQRVSAQADAEGLLQLGYEYCAAGWYLECSWASREAVRLAPADARAHNNLCAAYNGLHDWQGAIAACRQALQLQPEFPLARGNLDWALRQSQMR